MQISPTTPARATPLPSGGLAAQVRELASIFADGSTASREQMLDAYVAYSRLRTATAWDDPAGFYKQTTQQERDAINAIVRDSPFVQQLNATAERFSSKLNAAARSATDGAYGRLDAFNALSEWDQKLVHVGLGWNKKSATIEDLKAQLKADGDRALAAAAKDGKPPKPVDKVSLSSDARAVLGLPETPKTEAEQALSALSAPPAETPATAALKALEKAAEARRAEAEERAKAERRQAPGLYRSGDNVSVDA